MIDTLTADSTHLLLQNAVKKLEDLAVVEPLAEEAAESGDTVVNPSAEEDAESGDVVMNPGDELDVESGDAFVTGEQGESAAPASELSTICSS